MMRRLQHAEALVAQKPADGDLQKGTCRDVVAVEDGDVRRVQSFEGAIDVAGLGVFVVVAGHVADAGLFGEGAKLGTFAVIKDVDVELVGRPIHVDRGQGGVANNAERLVVAGDEDVDGGPVFCAVGKRHRGAAQRPECLQIAESKNDEGVALREDEKEMKNASSAVQTLRESVKKWAVVARRQ